MASNCTSGSTRGTGVTLALVAHADNDTRAFMHILVLSILSSRGLELLQSPTLARAQVLASGHNTFLHTSILIY